MSYIYKINKKHNMILLKRFGKFSFQELQNSAKNIFKLIKENNIKRIFNDLTDADAINLTSENLGVHGASVQNFIGDN